MQEQGLVSDQRVIFDDNYIFVYEQAAKVKCTARESMILPTRLLAILAAWF